MLLLVVAADIKCCAPLNLNQAWVVWALTIMIIIDYLWRPVTGPMKSFMAILWVIMILTVFSLFDYIPLICMWLFARSAYVFL